MSEYDIYINNKNKIKEWILQQPNFVSMVESDGGNKIYCVFNHTPTEEIAFKQNIADRFFQIDIGNNTFENTLSKLSSIQTDLPLYTTEMVITKNNIGTIFIDYFNDYGGRSFFTDTTGFKKIRYHLFMRTNGSTGVINFRLVDNGNESNVLLDEIITNGQNQNTLPIPDPLFTNFRGRLKIQVKSTVATDDPIFEGLRLYLIR